MEFNNEFMSVLNCISNQRRLRAAHNRMHRARNRWGEMPGQEKQRGHPAVTGSHENKRNNLQFSADTNTPQIQ